MKTLLIFTMSMVLFLLCHSAVAQKQDTTSNGEELLLASGLFKKSDSERRIMLLQPRFSHINKKDKPSLIKIGYRPDFAIGLGGGREPGEGRNDNLALGFEQLFKSSPFSWNVETLTRLRNRPIGTYEYRVRTPFQGEGKINNRDQEGGEFYNHRFRAHLTLRYYYNQKSRREAGVSGHNTASEYLFFRFRDVLAFTEQNEYSFSPERRLERHVYREKWLFRPSYFSMGWGTQRPLFKKGLVDFNVELGKRFPTSDFKHFLQDVFFDINLFIGLGL